MIKLGNKDITLKLGSTNISAAYLGSIQVYGGGHSYDLCYGVTDDISTYTGTFKDVFDKSSDTWYKRNNLNEYEEYGVYGSGRNITTYEGKLTIDGDYEYQYTNGAWVNVGEVSGSTTSLPDVPFTVNINAKNYDSTTKKFAKTQGQLADTDVTITQGTVTPHDDYVTVTGNTRGVIGGYQQYFNRDNNNLNFTIISKHRTADSTNIHLFANRDGNYNWMYRPASTQLKFHGTSQINGVAVTTQPVIGGVRVDSNRNLIFNNYTNNTTTTSTNFSYGSTNSGGVALFAGYTANSGEWFQGDFYWIYISQNTLTDAQVQQVIDYNEDTGSVEYPIYYDEKADPLDNITFNSLAEAEAYAYTHCVYDGMKATIAGEKYVFDSTNGWTIVQEYYIVTDVTPGGASGWTITGSSTYNPDSSYYDDFSVDNATTSYVTKIAKVTIYGYENFTYYLRSRFYSYNYGYAVATNVDELSSVPSVINYNASTAITNTYDFQKDPASLVNLSNYRRVTYNNLDKTVEHTFYVVFYGRRRSGSQANATILIPKYQTNENWEQVEFSASTNIASQEKNLYIDGNNLLSGGTNRFYYRWIIGLPAGTHTGYTNYSNYNYCPSVSSATFTSVAGNSRKIDFVYDNIQTKSLQFNLVDSSGNTLTPSDTVYINLLKYSECGGYSGGSVTFPRTDTVVRGGRFSFTPTTPAQQYIYGYQPPSLPTQYYHTDDYQSTFDIVYTKLSEEAVTLSYVTFDPNDSETPSFKTEITYPYNGGTTSATTLASFNVPYTYPYTVEQTNNLFSATPQTYTYTAGQASRTLSFTLYPNNREFTTVADLEAYQYAWEGMRAYVGSTNYQYKNGQWVEIAYYEYEYIETENASGKFYDFITNFYPTKSHTIETKFELVNQSIDGGGIVGWNDGNSDHTFTFETVTNSYQIIVRTGNNNYTINKYGIGENVKTVVTMPLSGNTGHLSKEGGTSQDFGYNYSTFTLPANIGMCLFGRGTANRRQGAVARMFYTKVYDENHNLVKHYVASDYNGTPCFYEKVDGEFVLDTYAGSNHGTCTLGNPVTPQTLQWVTFNSGDDISGLNVYGVKGVAVDLSSTFASNFENIYFELSRNIVNAFIGDYINPCYTYTYGINDNVELIFGNIGCSDYYTLPASRTASSTIQLYIYQ